jgi:hypothetical protein
MKIPSLYYEMGEIEQSDNATFKYYKNKIIIHENNAVKAVNILIILYLKNRIKYKVN